MSDWLVGFPEISIRHAGNFIEFDLFIIDLFTPRVSYGDIKMILTSESVDEILWCDNSNETLSAVPVLSHGTIYI